MIEALTATAALRKYSELPGPRRLPFVGNGLDVRREPLHLLLERWAREFGEVYRWGAPGREMMTVSDHKVVAAVLRDRPATFSRPERIGQISKEIGLPPGVFRANGADWQRQRRMVMSGLDPTHVKAYMPSINRVANRLLSRWNKAADSGAQIDLQGDLMRYTVDTIAGLAFGAEVNTLQSDGEVIQNHLDKIFPALRRRATSIIPYWRWISTERDRQLAHSVREVLAAIEGFIGQARARLVGNPELRDRPSNLLESMIVASDTDESRLTDEEVAGNVLTMLLAGEDTTANSLAWMIDLLMRNPATLARAQSEIRAWLPAGGELAFDTQRLGELPYLDACIQEAMRLKPVAPFIPVEANTDTVVAGVQVPAGTLVFCLLRHDSMQETSFPNAGGFMPERWLEDAQTLAARQVSMPFGAGARICPGRYLALLEMKIAMAVLLGRFDITEITTPGGLPPAEELNFTMAPVGIRMKLRRINHSPTLSELTG